MPSYEDIGKCLNSNEADSKMIGGRTGFHSDRLAAGNPNGRLADGDSNGHWNGGDVRLSSHSA
eukprot:7039175-Pyramimonas_sp.AAC.1